MTMIPPVFDALLHVQLTPLCLIAVRSHDWISKAIANVTRGYREEATRATHVEITRTHSEILTYACGKGARLVSVSERSHAFRKSDTDWCVYMPTRQLRPQDIFAAQLQMLQAPQWTKYGAGEIVLQLVDGLWAKIRRKRNIVWARKLGRLRKNTLICSTALAPIVIPLGLLPPDAWYYSPDDVDDFCARSPSLWTPIARSAHWPMN